MTVLHVQNADVPPQDRSTGPAPDHGPDVREDLLRFAELGGFTLAADTHAWYAAIDTVTGPEEARAASTVLAEVRGGGLSGAQDAATRLVAGSDLREPATLTEANALIGLGRRLQDTAVTLGSGAYVEDLDALAAATASSAWRKERGLKLSWGRRRKLRSQARLLAVADRPRRDALHAALVAAAAERTDWAALAMSGAASVVRPLDGTQLEATAQSVEALAGALRELGRLLPDHDLTALPFADLADLVDRLAADEGTLYRLSELRTLRASLEAAGLADLLADLTTAHADRTATEAAYRRHTGEAEAAEPAEEVVAAVEAEAAVEPEVEAAVEAEAEIEVEAEAGTEAETAWQALAAGPREALDNEPTPEPEPAPELEPVAVVEPEPEPEPVAEPEPEPVAVAVVEPAPEAAAPAPEAPAPAPAKRSRRPRKPDLTPGRPVTAYTPAELLALVRWIDGDAVERTDDELLRAAMKELGFARMGPRIKDALGAAVTEARL